MISAGISQDFQSFREYRVGLRGQLELLSRPKGCETPEFCPRRNGQDAIADHERTSEGSGRSTSGARVTSALLSHLSGVGNGIPYAKHGDSAAVDAPAADFQIRGRQAVLNCVVLPDSTAALCRCRDEKWQATRAALRLAESGHEGCNRRALSEMRRWPG